ncbi:calpain-13 [Microcebus murinus]|uniref:calpain-13 n=1 Tax=Microcebus murinus TaxID=30608 RepID=UPI003F6B82D7
MAHNQELLAETNVIKFKDQDFNSLRDRCLSRGWLFEDETFPAMASSIGQKLLREKFFSNIEWKRPQDLSNGSPHFILEGVSRFDIQQGKAGDCWFLAALGSLTQNPRYLQKILMVQSFSHQYAGIFRFRFWQCGQWVEVVIDDRLPVVGKEYLFVHPRNDNQEFWPCLLEKAYAKLLGSYSHLHKGYLPDALVDLTGGVVNTIHLSSSPSHLLTVVKTAAMEGSLMTCATPNRDTGSAVMANGLVSGHAYTVTRAEQIQYRKGQEEIICLWNPWGKTEWKGRWSDGSREWQETSDPRKSQLYENKEDGEFWMSCQDFQKNFSHLSICTQTPITLDYGNTLRERWSLKVFMNQVVLRNTPGGLQSKAHYLFYVQEQTEGTNVVVSFTVTGMPPSMEAEKEQFPLNFQVFQVTPRYGSQSPSLGFPGLCCCPLLQCYTCSNALGLHVISSPDRVQGAGKGRRAGEQFHPTFRSPVQSINYQHSKRNFTASFHLNPGTYAVVPKKQRYETGFLLRIFLKMPDSDRYRTSGILNESPSETGSQQSIFYRYAQQGQEIDATQLQSLLNQELLTGPPGDTFSLDQCRSILALMDLQVNGRLNQEEFTRLWKRLVTCQCVFQNIQKSPGVLLSSDLGSAIANADFLAGISISDELLGLMTLRYSDPAHRVSFPSLVCFLMRLEAMAKTFRNLSKDGKGLYLTETEWMNLVMYN